MFDLADEERRQGPLVPAIKAACIAVRTRQLAMAKAADAMDLSYVAQAYTDRAGKLLDDIQGAIAVAGLEEQTTWEAADGLIAVRAPIGRGGLPRS